MRHLLSLSVHQDQDVVTARQRAVHITHLLGFERLEQTGVAAAVSEIVSNACRYAKGGVVSFLVDDAAAPQRLIVRVTDQGSGIPGLEDVLSGRCRSGAGIGVVGAHRLVDRFTIESTASGTTVILEKYLSPHAEPVTAARARAIAEAVALKRPEGPEGPVEDIEQQNQRLLLTLDLLQRKQLELVELNRELEDTNRGIVALHAALDEKADHLRRTDQLKSRFLSNVSHELRTPLNSIIGLANLMIDDRRQDGRDPEPEVLYIRKAAEQLSELVNDLLDLAVVEAGKTVVRPGVCDVRTLFAALRGMVRPLLPTQSVSLVFDPADDLPPLYTDEGKLSQILRNLLSNALKFTEQGEVRVSASQSAVDGPIRFSVADTGIGIAPADQARIFDEFTQLEHPLQRDRAGAGLGLALSKRLTELLGGTLSVESEPGMGSTFTVAIPLAFPILADPGDRGLRVDS